MRGFWGLTALILAAGSCLGQPISNGSFERMESGSVPVGWQIYNRFATGQISQDRSVFHSGAASLRLSQVLGFYGIGSEKLPFYPWQKSLTITAWVKASQGGRFDLWLVWFNRDNVAMTVSTVVTAGTYDWKQVVLTDTQPPPGAGRYQVICASETGVGDLWMDDVSASIGANPRTQILVNQVGYRTGWPKTFLVQSSQSLQAGSFDVLDSGDQVVSSGTTKAVSAPGGWPYYYLRGDFTALDSPGTFHIRISQGSLTSYAFAIGANPYAQAEDLARQFYYFQRCGAKISGWHGYCHLDDGSLDGTHRQEIGGWHEAGDYIKSGYGQPIAFFALSRLAAVRTSGATSGKILDEAKWGASFVTKLIDPATGRLLEGVFNKKFFWGRPEDETDGVPGNSDDREVRSTTIWGADNVFTAAGFATLSPLAGKPDYLSQAEALWQKVRNAGAVDALNLGRLVALDTILFQQTGDTQYRDQAYQDIDHLIGIQNADGGFQRHSMTDRGVPAAGLAMWAVANPSDAYVPRIKSALRRFLRNVNASNRNPFGIYTYDTSNFFFPYTSIDEWKVGENSDYLSVVWAVALAGKVVRYSPGNKKIIQNHLDWVMGKNPFGVCMIEGVGSYNPQFYHHRYDTIPGHSDGAVPGAIPNGLIRESIDSVAPRFDILGNSFETNEPWMPHNSYFLLAMSELF